MDNHNICVYVCIYICVYIYIYIYMYMRTGHVRGVEDGPFRHFGAARDRAAGASLSSKIIMII